MNREDEAWWDALAGKPADNEHAVAARDAARYRQALLRAAKTTESRRNVNADLERFRAALRSEGNRDHEPGGIRFGIAQWLRALTLPRMALAMIALLAVGVVLKALMPPAPELPGGVVYRGFEPGRRVYLEVEHPAASQSSLTAELKALGVEASALTEPDGKGGYVVQAAVSLPASPALQELLKRYGLPDFPGGRLDIAFTGKQPQH